MHDIPCDIVYATSNNFVGRPLKGYLDPVCIASNAMYEKLKVAQRHAVARGYSLLIYDAYRPLKAVEDILNWTRNEDETTKSTYYPDIDKGDLFDLGYVALRSGHTRGSAVDVTLFDLATREPVDMGTIFDYFGPESATAYPDLPPEVRRSRQLLVHIMALAGLENLPEEWWHYSLPVQPYPTTYFDSDVRSECCRRST